MFILMWLSIFVLLFLYAVLCGKKVIKNKHIKTLNLEQLGVQEMNAVEVKSVDGGFLGLIAIGLCIAAGTAIINDWDNFERGLSGQAYQK